MITTIADTTETTTFDANEIKVNGAAVESAFGKLDINPFWDRDRYLRGEITRDAVQEQVTTFLQEYLTRLTTQSFSYTYEGEHLTAAGWSGHLIDSYNSAIFHPGIDNRQQAFRVAEALSFEQIESELLQTPQSRVILQSPDRGYGYTYVSMYERNEKTGTVDVNVYRILTKQSNTTDHVGLRSSWLERYNTSRILQPDHEKQLDLISRVTSTVGEIYKYSNDVRLLASPTTMNKNEVSAQELLNDYYNPEFVDQLNIQDAMIAEQMEDFYPEINMFINDLLNEGSSSNEVIEQFKILLLKAKVHFDPEDAERLWGTNVVTEIQKQTQRLAGPIAEDTNTNYLMHLEIELNGSCGFVADARVDELLQIISPASKILNPDRPDRSNACEFCGFSWPIKLGNSSTYEKICPRLEGGCGGPATNLGRTC